jgi:hemolysin activation/secretion protein
VDTLGATQNATGPDGQFVSLLGQVQYVRRLWNTANELVLKVAGQYSPDPLMVLEQLALGGANSVRGYRENTMVRDQGVLASAEFHAPLWRDKEDRHRLEVVPFADFGGGWDHVSVPHPFDTIGSVGVGLVFSPFKNVNTSLFWGHALRQVDYPDHHLQDDGIHFQLMAWAF